MLAGLTRPTAVCLPALFLPDLISRRSRPEALLSTLACAASPLAGVALYVSYVGWRNDDPLAYPHLVNIWWAQSWTLPFRPLLSDLQQFPIDLIRGRLPPADIWVRLASSLCILTLIVWGWRKIGLAFSTYLVIAFLFIHSQEPHHSTVRYELVLFSGVPATFAFIRRTTSPEPISLPAYVPLLRFSIFSDMPPGCG